MHRYLAFLLAMLVFVLASACAVRLVTPNEATGQPTGEEAGEEAGGELIVFAAASLTDVFSEIATGFQAQVPSASVVYNFAGSQQLSQQLGQGAPADVFASANARQMEVAIEVGRVVSGAQYTFVHNRLVVIYPADNPAEIISLQDLAKPGLRLVLAAAEVPVGGYSLDFLNKAAATVEYGGAYSESVLSNVVSYEANVRSVLSKVALGEADAGIIYASDIFGDSADQVGQIEIPDELNSVASYPLAPVIDSANAELAQRYVDYVLSEEGQAILEEYGFIGVDKR